MLLLPLWELSCPCVLLIHHPYAVFPVLALILVEAWPSLC